MSAQELVDAWYRNLINAQYDAAHGHVDAASLRHVEERYQEALATRDAEARQQADHGEAAAR